jgi:hypothetical protein
MFSRCRRKILHRRWILLQIPLQEILYRKRFLQALVMFPFRARKDRLSMAGPPSSQPKEQEPWRALSVAAE